MLSAENKRRPFMNRAKYRACLICLVLAAIVFGIVYYFCLGKEEKGIPNGTFVYRMEETDKRQAA